MKDGDYCENHPNVTQTQREQVLPGTWQRGRPWAQGPREAAACDARRRARPPCSVTVGKHGQHKVGHLHTRHVCSAVALGTFTLLCNRHRCPSTELSYHPDRKAVPAEHGAPGPLVSAPADLSSPLARGPCSVTGGGVPRGSEWPARRLTFLLLVGWASCGLSVPVIDGAVKPPSWGP